MTSVSEPMGIATGIYPPRWPPYEYQAMTTRVKGWRPPLSPLGLAQEMVPSQWGVYLASMVHVRTRRSQGHPALWRILGSWPKPEDLLSNGAKRALPDVLAPLGLADQRGHQLREAAVAWREGLRPGAGGFPGAGPYIDNAYRLFVTDQYPRVDCQDGELSAFVVWAIMQRRKSLPWRHGWDGR